MIFNEQVIADAKRHAREEYPKESCGLVVGGKYYPCRNAAEDPLNDFVIHMGDQAKAMSYGPFQAVIHSHPHVDYSKEAILWPTQSDMEYQIKTGVPWAIVPVDGDRISDLVIWGGDTPIAPLVGRKFVPGITDCYAIIRDIFRLGREELAKQDIEWPLDPVLLPEVPRDHGWWDKGQDLYEDHFRKFGFKEITFNEAKPGDVFLINVGKTEIINHGGVLIGNNLLIQHFPERLSTRAPAGLWARQAKKWIRYVGSDQSILTEAKV